MLQMTFGTNFRNFASNWTFHVFLGAQNLIFKKKKQIEFKSFSFGSNLSSLGQIALKKNRTDKRDDDILSFLCGFLAIDIRI